MDVFRNSSISTHQFSRSTSAWLFPANRPLVWCHSLGSHIRAFLNSVRLPSLRHESIYIEVNKLQFTKPSNQVWHHTPATSLGRLSSSHAFQLVTFPYDESICWQTNRLFAVKRSSAYNRKCFAPHPCKRRKFDLDGQLFPFGSKLTIILENVRRNVSKLPIFLTVARLRNSCLPYFN